MAPYSHNIIIFIVTNAEADLDVATVIMLF